MFVELILVGNVGRDPEMNYTSSGLAICNFTMATNRRWNDTATGEARQETTWWRVAVWGKQGETVNQYVSKGSKVLVVADRVEANAYMGNDGEPRASLQVTARQVRFLSGRGEDGGGSYDDSGSGDAGNTKNVDDIPF